MTMDSLRTSWLRPAARASQHGHEMVRIKTGHGERRQTFTIHKDLIGSASDFFQSAFKGGFLESQTSCLELTTVDPMTFEVLYQWLYTGSVRDIINFAVESDIKIDLLWLRVLTMAHQYMITPLQEISYCYFRKAFHDLHRVVPSVALVKELYESDLPTNLVDMLKSYLLLHCVYWIMDDSCNCWEWQIVLKHPHFGADVAWEMTKRGSKDYLGLQSHPRHNAKFANYNGHVFVKKDCDEEDNMREPASSDDETFHDGCSFTSQNAADLEHTEISVHW